MLCQHSLSWTRESREFAGIPFGMLAASGDARKLGMVARRRRKTRLLKTARCTHALSRLVPWALCTLACGGSSLGPSNDKVATESGGQANHDGDGGRAAAAGHADESGSGGIASHTGSSGGSGGGSAGTGAQAGTGTQAGSGGAQAGTGGAQTGGGGSAGTGAAGSGGNSSVCHATPPVVCGGGAITLSRSCVAEEMASAGSSLPLATCRVMCESMFTFACSVSTVTATSVTVQCSTGCPGSGS